MELITGLQLDQKSNASVESLGSILRLCSHEIAALESQNRPAFGNQAASKLVQSYLHQSVSNLPFFNTMSKQLQDFIKSCLTISPLERPTPRQLTHHPCFDLYLERIGTSKTVWTTKPATKAKHTIAPNVENGLSKLEAEQILTRLPQSPQPTAAATESTKPPLVRHSVPVGLPSITQLPAVVTLDSFDPTEDTTLSRHQSREISLKRFSVQNQSFFGNANVKDIPVTVREKQIAYQRQRIQHFNKLLLGYPHTKEEIIQQVDVRSYGIHVHRRGLTFPPS